MLHIIVNDGTWLPDNCSHSAASVFNVLFENEWMEHDIVPEMVLDIDKTTMIAPRIFDSPYLGLITPKELSGGVKFLIMLLNEPTKRIYDLDNIGDNCAKWLQRIVQKVDVIGCLSRPLDLKDDEPWSIHIMNDDSYPKCWNEYFDSYIRSKHDRETFFKVIREKGLF